MYRGGDRKVAIILGVAGLIFIVISLYLLHDRGNNKRGYSLAELPKEAVDVTGRVFEQRFLKDKAVIVQYGGEIPDQQLDAWREYEDQISYVFILDKKPDTPLPVHKNYFILNIQSVKSFDRFNGRYFVLDHSGNMVHWGYYKGNNADGIGLALAFIFHNFKPADIFPDNREIEELLRVVPKSEYVVLVLFRSFCFTCRNGTLLKRLERIHSLRTPNAAIIVVLDANVYSEEEKHSLAAQAAMPFPIILSEPTLTARLNYMSFQYGGSLLDGVLYLFKGGLMLDVADVSCRCDERFFQNIEQLALKGDSSE